MAFTTTSRWFRAFVWLGFMAYAGVSWAQVPADSPLGRAYAAHQEAQGLQRKAVASPAAVSADVLRAAFAKAADLYREALAKPDYPDNVVREARALRAETLFAAERFEEAAVAYDEVCDQTPAPRNAFDLALGAIIARQKLFEAGYAAAGQKPTPALVDLADAYGSAADRLAALRPPMPKDREQQEAAQFRAAQLQLQVDHKDDAARRFDALARTAVVRQDLLEAAIDQALAIYRDAKQVDAAVALIDAVIDGGRVPLLAGPLARARTGFVGRKVQQLSETGDEDQAIRTLLAEVQRNPKAPTSCRALFNAAMKTDKRDRTDEARALLVRLVNEYPTCEDAPRAAYLAAEGYERAGDNDNALKYLEILIRDHPKSPEGRDALKNAALIAEQAGNLERAAEYQLELGRRTPEQVGPALGALKAAELYLRARKPARAESVLADFLKQLGKQPKDADLLLRTLFTIGIVQESTTRFADARRSFQQVLDTAARLGVQGQWVEFARDRLAGP